MNILVSINCITYNHEEYIADAIESFLKQKTNFNYEILIGEDCSTDSTREIVDEYVKKYPDKIRMITSEKNVGARENAKRVLEASKGKYIAECEGDDYWIDPLKLQKQIEYLEENPTCTLCFHDAYILNARKKSRTFTKHTLINKANPHYRGANSNYNAGELALLGFIPTASYIYPKSTMEFPPDWYDSVVVGDNAIKLIATSKGYAHYFDEVMSVYRVGVKGSVSDNWRKESVNISKQIKLNKGFIELFEHVNSFTNYKYNVEIDQSKIPFEIQTLLLKRKKIELKELRYTNYISQLTLTGKFKYYSRLFFPSFYIIFLQFKSYLLRF